MPTCDIAIIIVCAGRHGTTERRAGAPGMNTKYDRLKNSNHVLAEQKQELISENAVLREEKEDFRRLKRAVGEAHSEYLIQNEKGREMAEKNRRKVNKRSHDRDAR